MSRDVGKANRHTCCATSSASATDATSSTSAANLCRVSDATSATVATRTTNAAGATIGRQRCAVSFEGHVARAIEHQESATSFTGLASTTETTNSASA
jgi:hypothetical protein